MSRSKPERKMKDVLDHPALRKLCDELGWHCWRSEKTNIYAPKHYGGFPVLDMMDVPYKYTCSRCGKQKVTREVIERDDFAPMGQRRGTPPRGIAEVPGDESVKPEKTDEQQGPVPRVQSLPLRRRVP